MRSSSGWRLPALVVWSAVVLLGLACSGVPGGPCCSVEDILAMQQQGVATEVMIDAIRTSGTDLALTARDIGDLTAAGVDREVIDVLNGGPCVCAAQPEPRPGSVIPEPAEPDGASLNVRVVHDGGKSFEVVNLSSVTYTDVTVVINGEWKYQLKRLPAGKGDVMRYGNFRSMKTGEELRKGKLQTVTVRARQGSYTQSF